MKNSNIFNVVTASIGSFLSSVLGILYIPVLILMSCNIADYISGIMAAKYREVKISSYKSIRGIYKKVAMWMLIVVGAVVDKLLIYTSATLGFTWGVPYIMAAFVAVWLICNELISILENLQDMDVPMPVFLMPIIKNIARKTEDALTIDERKEKEEEQQ